MVTLSTLPSAAARTASSPSSAPVGTTMRAPVSRARATRCIRGSSAPTLLGTKMRPRAIAASAICSKTAAGAASTTISACSASSASDDQPRRRAEAGDGAPRLLLVARRDRDEAQPLDARIQRAREMRADRAEPTDRHRHFARHRKCLMRCVPGAAVSRSRAAGREPRGQVAEPWGPRGARRNDQPRRRSATYRGARLSCMSPPCCAALPPPRC